MGNASLDGIDGGASLDRQFPIRPIRPIRLIRPILPILPKTQRYKQKKDDHLVVWNFALFAEGRIGIATLAHPVLP